jgi:hypothetical protein
LGPTVAGVGEEHLAPTDINFSSNILTNTSSSFSFPSTPGYIDSVALMGDGTTYFYNPTGSNVVYQNGTFAPGITAVGSGTSTDFFDPFHNTFTINSTTFGSLTIFLDNSNSPLDPVGDYVFTPPTNVSLAPLPYDIPIQFTMNELGNHEATGILTLTDISKFDPTDNLFSYTGNGSDILEFNQNSGNLSLSASINNIGEFLFNDNASTGTTMTLTPEQVFDSSATSNNTLFVNGNANDTLHIGPIGGGPGQWTDTGAASGYEVYTQTINSHAVTLEVQQTVHVVA